MTTVLGCDYAFAPHPLPGYLAAAGYRYAYRYIGPGSAGKKLSDQERRALHAAGIGVGLLVEGTGPDILTGGATLGHTHAQEARNDMAALGVPAGTVVVFSADVNITAANLSAAVDYFRGVNSLFALQQIGAYCDTDLARELVRLGLATFFFKPAATSWSTGLFLYDVIQLAGTINVGGADIDECTAPTMPHGLWAPTRTTTPPQGDTVYILHATPSTSCYALRGNILTPISLVDDLAKLQNAFGLGLVEVTDADITKGLYGALSTTTPPTPIGLTAADLANELSRRLAS
jgi:hypothetical protein